MKISVSSLLTALIFSIIAVILLSCADNKPRTEFSGTTIDIVNPSDDFMNFVADYDTIRLETTDDALIDQILKMKIMNGRFFILNTKFNMIFIFTEKGKFINKISDTGQGPSEYIRITGFEVDPVHNKILISDNFSRRLFVYNEDGRQEQIIPLGFNREHITSDGADGYINFFSSDNEGYSEPEMRKTCIHFLDKDCRFVSAQLPMETRNIELSTMRPVDCHADGSIYYQPILSDIIYCVKDREVHPYYKFRNKSDYRMLSEKDRKEMTLIYGERNDFKEKQKEGYIVPWGNVIDTDNYLYTVFEGGNEVHLFYDKQTGKSIVFDSDKLSKKENTSNLFLKYVHCAKGDVFYSSPNYYWLNKAYKTLSAMPESKLKKYLQNTDVDANPLIISFSIKVPEVTQ
ncbi:MAG: 6-bladed beta-propeller [Tannerella sp.]|jgi:hypothetical protein|nr:6-bladed beta-propeller [Tannerella sp.]